MDDAPADTDDTQSREIVVPLRLYKTVTVFSTLIAMLCVVAGFLLIDAATKSASVPASKVNLPFALAGIALILGGAAVYAFSTRFRSEGMGNAKDDENEASDNDHG